MVGRGARAGFAGVRTALGFVSLARSRRPTTRALDPDRPGKSWFLFLRLYGPLEPWFDKTWRPEEIDRVD